MADPESSGIEKWAQYVISAIIGGVGMLLGLSRAWQNLTRKVEDTAELAQANAAMRDRDDARIQALERNESAAEARYTALLKGHERIEGKIDRLAERLGG